MAFVQKSPSLIRALRYPIILALCVLNLKQSSAKSLNTREELDFFETKIRPTLSTECYECHGVTKKKGGLRLDYRDGLLKGGESGAAIIPGNANKSLLFKAITHTDKDLKMPDNAAKLDERIIADFKTWIDMGAPDPREEPPSATNQTETQWETKLRTRKDWWSFQPVKKPSLPIVKDPAWSKHPVDQFILSRLDAHDLQPAAPAPKPILLRRISFALTGLPPTPEEIRMFLEDSSTNAYEKVVDRLLASPRFGECWARHWMDLMRFAETHGSEGDPEIPQAWRYRDYLIRAFNADLPYNEFVREQIAGDLLPRPRWNKEEGFNESILGIAQFRLVEHGFQPVDALEDQVKVIENQIDVIGKTFEALTISCARCHDHKFDPISQHDFYALYGIMASLRPAEVTIDSPDRLRVHRSELERIKTKIKSALVEEWEKAAFTLTDDLLLTAPKSTPAPDDALNERIDSATERLSDLQRRAEEQAYARKGTNIAIPIAVWTFDGNAKDLFGRMDGELAGRAVIQNGRLVLDGKGSYVRTAPLWKTVTEKTLEVWVALEDLEQRGGGVVTLQTENGSSFDSIVFGEQEKGKWFAGSENFKRSRPSGGPAEMAGSTEFVQLAIAYRADKSVAIYRNGLLYGSAYTPEAESIKTYEPQSSHILFGLRHTGADNGFLHGQIEEAHLYDQALNSEQIAASFKWGLTKKPADIPTILTTEEQSQKTSLELEIASRQQELRSRFPNYPQKQKTVQKLNRILETASREKGHPLYAWAILHTESGAEFQKIWSRLTNYWNDELAVRRRFNSEKFKKTWNLATGDDEKWFARGINPPEKMAQPGEFCVEPEGDKILGGLYPAAVISHRLSQKHNGVLMSPRFKVESDNISVFAFGGKGARVRLIPDNYPLGTEGIFPQRDLSSDTPAWVKIDTAYRKGSQAYLEFVSAEDDLARNRPPSGEGGRSYFGVREIVFHNTSETPREDLIPVVSLFGGTPPQSLEQLTSILQQNLIDAIRAWSSDQLTEPQCALLNVFLRDGLLPNSTNQLPTLIDLIMEYRRLESEIPNARRAPGVIETVGYDAPLFSRGDHTKPTATVPRRFLEVLGSHAYKTALSGRLELAEEIVNPTNPLTSRVIVNRVWHQLFGRGLVATVDNFGRMGDHPTHPELLDYLAAAFIKIPQRSEPDPELAFAWSLKALIRFIVTSRTYQMASFPSSRASEIDPSNELLSHIRVRRIEAEAVRDSMLAISGQWDQTMYGPGSDALGAPSKQRRRSIYLFIRRNSLSPFLEVFDAPKPFTTLGRREETNVPAQSLTLLNDPFAIELSKFWAAALVRKVTSVDERVTVMFQQAFARLPKEDEIATVRKYLASLASEHNISEQDLMSNEDVWRDFAQSLFNFKEFIYLQ